MGKDAGWNLLASDRLIPQAIPNKDAAWEASGVFFPAHQSNQLSAGITDRKDARSPRSPSPTGDLAPATVMSQASAFVKSRLCAPSRRIATCPFPRNLRAPMGSGRGRSFLLSSRHGASLTMSGDAAPLPSWVSRAQSPKMAGLCIGTLCSQGLSLIFLYV